MARADRMPEVVGRVSDAVWVYKRVIGTVVGTAVGASYNPSQAAGVWSHE
jgi:hypothetical protein